MCHGLRVHYQVIEWKMLDGSLVLDPREWGWKKDGDHLVPIPTTKEVAPENLLMVIRCKCKSKKNTCGTNLCTCRKHGIKCLPACGGCHGEDCTKQDGKFSNQFYVKSIQIIRFMDNNYNQIQIFT